jgi:hypothetical protein
MVIAAADIVKLLRISGRSNAAAVEAWLNTSFPNHAPT